VTVSPEHRAAFERLLAERTPALAARHGGSWRVRFREQHPATDTLAGDPAGGPFRDEHGQLLFRPAGHGALLRNLEETGGDLVFLKNIDNVAVSRLRAETARWSAVLVGLAAELAEGIARHATAVERGEPAAVDAARAFARGGQSSCLRARRTRPCGLDRCECGMVANTGGRARTVLDGDAGGVRRQIVESAQVTARTRRKPPCSPPPRFNRVFSPSGATGVAAHTRTGPTRGPGGHRDPRKSQDPAGARRPALNAMAHWHTRFDRSTARRL
jgi:hypothetical protein